MGRYSRLSGLQAGGGKREQEKKRERKKKREREKERKKGKKRKKRRSEDAGEKQRGKEKSKYFSLFLFFSLPPFFSFPLFFSCVPLAPQPPAFIFFPVPIPWYLRSCDAHPRAIGGHTKKTRKCGSKVGKNALDKNHRNVFIAHFSILIFHRGIFVWIYPHFILRK